MISQTVFLVDDDDFIRDAAKFDLGREYNIKTFSSAEPALTALDREQPDLVLLDIGLPGMTGLEALTEIRRRRPGILVIMITAVEDVSTVVSAMKQGAYDYVVKPFQMEALKVRLANALSNVRLRKEVQLVHEIYLKEHLPCFIGQSDVILDVMELVSKVSASPDTPVLIYGETGTGKELIASAIHYKSPNYRGPFISLNCSAIPADLLESELFGYEKGAFSGANAAGKKGLVEQAENGTLFLDEIGDMSLEAQAKLLRFMEEGEYYRVGGAKKLKTKTRIVSATNRNLEKMVEQDLFRRDFYHRLAVIKIEVPSLNERPDDIMPIARHFLQEFSAKFKRDFQSISAEAEKALKNYLWKGNVRELKNVIERAVLLGQGPGLTVEDLRLMDAGTEQSAAGQTGLPSFSPDGFDLNSVLEEIEKSYIRQALTRAGGNASRAARLLNMGYYTFRRRREKLDL